MFGKAHLFNSLKEDEAKAKEKKAREEQEKQAQQKANQERHQARKKEKAQQLEFKVLQQEAAKNLKHKTTPLSSSEKTHAAKRPLVDTANDSEFALELLVYNKDVDTKEERLSGALHQRLLRQADSQNNFEVPKDFYADGFSSTLPALNYLWVGPPRYEKGGHDIKGIMSIARNHVNFKTPKEKRNPIIFWCQGQYAKEYEEFFKAENIAVDVRSIDTCLLHDKNEFAAKVKKIYLELLGENRNRLHDRMYMKDLFSLYLLYRLTGGNGAYVLDTNVQAASNIPLKMSSYDHYRLPSVMKEREIINGRISDRIAECWMQFCPALSTENPIPHQILTRCLQEYIEKFDSHIKPLFAKYGYAEDKAYCNGGSGEHMIAALYWYGKRDFATVDDASWKCSEINEAIIDIEECGLLKEYYNTQKTKK